MHSSLRPLWSASIFLFLFLGSFFSTLASSSLLSVCLVEIVCKGSLFLSASSLEIFSFPWYILRSEGPWVPFVPMWLWWLCTSMIMYVHTPPPLQILRGKGNMMGWLLVAFSPHTVKLRAQSLGLSPPQPPHPTPTPHLTTARQGAKGVQLYQRVGPRDAFGCRLNLLRLCLYNNCAAVRGCLCLIPLWKGRFRGFLAAPLHQLHVCLNIN